jgi:hypothetical protein
MEAIALTSTARDHEAKGPQSALNEHVIRSPESEPE